MGVDDTKVRLTEVRWEVVDPSSSSGEENEQELFCR